MDLENSFSKTKKKSKKKKLEQPVEADVKVGKKKKKQEMNNNMSPVKELNQSHSSIDTTPEGHKKKKRKSTYDEGPNSTTFTEGHSSDEDLSMLSVFQTPSKKMKVDEPEQRNSEENQKLLSLALEQLQLEKVTFDKRLSSLDYNKIAEAFDDKSAKDCEIILKMLIEPIIKRKCLHQVLTETLEELPNEKSIPNSFANFIYLNGEQLDEELRKGELGNSKMTVAAALWKKMTKEEKKAFEPEKKKISKMDGQFAFDVYYVYLKKKNSEISNKEARLKWSNLKLTKKMKFIKKSAKIMQTVIESRDENDADNKKLKGPTKDEVAAYLEHVGVPKAPRKTASMFYFCKELLDTEDQPSNLLMQAIKAFTELSKAKQEEWTEKHKKAIKKYERALEEWKAQQDDVTLFIHSLTKPTTKAEKKRERDLKSPNKKDTSNLKVVEMPIGNIKFQAEPSVPPMTPALLFAKELEKNTGEKLSSNGVRERYATLDKVTKFTFQKKSYEIKRLYKEGLLEYVDKMVPEQKRLFLGLKRVRYIRVFGEDIFEEKYPNNDYPVYSRPEKGKTVEKDLGQGEPKKKKKKIVEEEEEDQEVEEEEEQEVDEVEEEEEEELSASSPPKQKKQTRDYTSRKSKSKSKAKDKATSKKKQEVKKPKESDESESDDETSYIY